MTLQQLAMAASILVGGYVLILIWVYLAQGRMVFLPGEPGRTLTATPESIGLAYDPVSLVTSDRIRLDGWFVPSPRERAVVAFFHGNAGNISHRMDTLRIFHELGLSVLIVDYRGYGQSEGSPSENGLYRDGEAVWDYLQNTRKIPAESIVLVGRSLGSAVAARLAAHHQPGALVLESPLISVPELGQAIYPYLPIRWLAKYRFPTLEFTAQARCPTLVIHSPDDNIVPITHGQRVFAAASGPKHFLELKGGHNASHIEDEPGYREGWEAFLAQHLSTPPPKESQLFQQ